jgi:hypothetical protein
MMRAKMRGPITELMVEYASACEAEIVLKLEGAMPKQDNAGLAGVTDNLGLRGALGGSWEDSFEPPKSPIVEDEQVPRVPVLDCAPDKPKEGPKPALKRPPSPELDRLMYRNDPEPESALRKTDLSLDVELIGLKEDIEQKQLIISRLVNETEKKDRAVKKCSEDLVELRGRRVELKSAVGELQREVAANRRAMEVVIRDEDLADVSREDLVRSYIQVGKKYAKECEAGGDNNTRRQQLQNRIIEFNSLEKKMLELQMKHTNECMHVQALQEQAERGKKLRGNRSGKER